MNEKIEEIYSRLNKQFDILTELKPDHPRVIYFEQIACYNVLIPKGSKQYEKFQEVFKLGKTSSHREVLTGCLDALIFEILVIQKQGGLEDKTTS